jgi:purine-binding chemotaxis protein CheW
MKETATRQFLTFVLADIELGLGILEVSQIIEHVPPTRVPHLPQVVRGVINLRGSIVPIVDLGFKLGLDAQPVTKRSCIVIVETAEAGQLGILADSVREVIDLPTDDVLPTPSFGVPVRADYLLGLGKVREKLVLLLDSARLLTPTELLATAEVIPELPPEVTATAAVAESAA